MAALAAGLLATLIVARAVGDPVRNVQEAMASVERGAFDARVQVDDGSEVGRLQAGFNRMAAGLAERERLRDLFGRHVGRDVAEAALDGELRPRRRGARGGGALRRPDRIDRAGLAPPADRGRGRC